MFLDSLQEENQENITPVPPTSERFVEITNKVYEEEYDEFMSGFRQAAKETIEA
jgi:ASC-1-like (ASCH) protein